MEKRGLWCPLTQTCRDGAYSRLMNNQKKEWYISGPSLQVDAAPYNPLQRNSQMDPKTTRLILIGYRPAAIRSSNAAYVCSSSSSGGGGDSCYYICVVAEVVLRVLASRRRYGGEEGGSGSSEDGKPEGNKETDEQQPEGRRGGCGAEGATGARQLNLDLCHLEDREQWMSMYLLVPIVDLIAEVLQHRRTFLLRTKSRGVVWIVVNYTHYLNF